MATITSILVATVAVLGLIIPLPARSDVSTYAQCESNLQCTPGHCCVISPIRYSVPQCKPMQAEGESCRPVADPTMNVTVTYPNGNQVDLTKINYVICPCANGLFCDRKSGVCKSSEESK